MSIWQDLFGGSALKKDEDEKYNQYMESLIEQQRQQSLASQLQNQQNGYLNNSWTQQHMLGQYQYNQQSQYNQSTASMAATPESKVKDKVCAALDDMDVYYTKPVTGGFGNSGVPDIVACVEGRFFGIECKAKGKKPTALQEKHLSDITLSGGVSLVIDETNVDTVRELILANIGVAK